MAVGYPAGMAVAKKTPKKKKGGAPRVEYDPGVLDELERYEGVGNGSDIQRWLGISSVVYFRWRKEYPEFEEKIMELKDRVDDKVESALLKRALGYDYFEHKERSESGGQHGDKTVTETVKKELPPDPGAAKHWLSLRRPDDWRETTQVEMSGSFFEMVEKKFNERQGNSDDT